MSKEQEELLLAGIVLLVFFKLISSQTQAQIAVTNAGTAQTVGFANAAANLGTNIADDYFGD